VVPPAERGFTMGILGIPLLVAPAIGPTLGGWLVDYVDWRTIFLINVPVGAMGLLLAMAVLRETETKPGLKFDLAGFLTAAVAFSCSLVALSNAPTDGWTAPYIVVLLIVSVIFFIAWIVVELTVAEPLLELRLFKDWIFSMGFVVLFVVTMALYGATLLLPLFLQDVRGLSAFDTGLLLLPQGIAAALAMPVGGKLFDKMGARPLVIFGLALLAAATWLYTSLDIDTQNHVIVIALIFRGLSLGFIFMPLQTAIMNRIPLQKINRGSSLLNALRQLFASFGVAIVTTVLTARQVFHQALLAERMTAGAQAVQRLSGAMSALAAQHGWTAQQAHGFLLYALNGEVQLRASVQAFDDSFVFIMVLCVVAMAPSLFLIRGKNSGIAEGAAMVME